MPQQLLKISENVVEADGSRLARLLAPDGHELTDEAGTLLCGVANLIGFLDQGSVGPRF